MAYLDASIVVSLFVNDVHGERVAGWLESQSSHWVSHWTVAEFSSAMSHYVRTARVSPGERDRAEAAFDRWLMRANPILPVLDDHFTEARGLMRLDSSLRAPDALHLGIAKTHRMVLATLDRGLAAAAALARVEARLV
jgi:predicted nucleic acid-binding protein